MRWRILLLAFLSMAMAWGGYQASVLRARAMPSASEVFASAGGEPGFYSGSEGRPESDSYRISALSIFSNVAIHVKDNYVDPARIEPKEMLVSALNEIERQVAEVLVEELDDGRVRVSVPGHEKLVTVRDVESLWEINIKLRDVFRFFEKHLPPQEDMRAVEYAAVNGALSTLDPHSILLKPEAFAEMKTSTKGEFGGLGIVISVRDAKLTIISPLEGTPASRAGLRALDEITRIGDVSTVSMPIEEAVRLLRGREGSKVTIWVQRKGWPEARKFTLTRERIKIESVTSKLLANNVGYIKIKNFQQNTGRDLDEHVQKLEKLAKTKLTGLVLDLRNNPGGLLEQAIRVSDKFLTSGDIVTTVGYGNKLREPKRAQWSSSDLDLPLAVLVNNGSASASEIVAGALKNLDRALIVGQRTFGKGSVQVLYDFSDNSALKLTIAQYLTPGGISIQNIGVAPDVELKPAVVTKDNVRLFYESDAHREKNLKKHLDRQNQDGVAGQEESKPAEHLTYLVEPDSEEELAEEEPSYDSVSEDFPIRFARSLLASSGRAKRSETLGNAKSFLEGARAEQEGRISEAIAALGIDWSAGTEGPATVSTELKIVGAAEDGRIVAGTDIQLEAKVRNVGQTPLYRIRGELETEHGSFRGREFLFGKIDPGQAKTWTIDVKIPKEAASRSDILMLNLASESGAISNRTSLPVITQYIPHPQFAYAFSIDDRERGDGDGILERGEGVDLIIHVTNVGPGGADKVSLRLKSAAGEDLFLERGRAEVGPVGAGETRSGRLQFRVRDNQSPERENLPLELTIYDNGTGEWLEDQFAVVAKEAGGPKVDKKKGSAVVVADSVLYGEPDKLGPVLATIKTGAQLRFDGKTDEFLRVDLDGAGIAWIPSSDVKLKSIPKKAKLLDSIAHQPTRRPPTIEIDGQLGGRVVDSDEVVLSGRIAGRELRDMYVVINDEKTFYAPGPKVTKPATTGAWTPYDERAVELPFSQRVKLDDGLNKILIVARLDEHVVTYRNLFVSKVKGSADAVAEVDRQGKPNPKNPN